MRELALAAVLVALGCGDDGASSAAGTGDTGATGTSTTGVSTGTGSGAGGGGGGGPGCGDGIVSVPEACDDGGESATCDADCSPVLCGDGVRNATAGEGCDDGNTADGDTCSATCSPVAFSLDPTFTANGSDDVAIAATAAGFAAVWTKNQSASMTTLRFATFGSAGATAPSDVVSGNGLRGTVGSNLEGRGLVLYTTYTAPSFTLGWRVVSPDGTLGAEVGSEASSQFWPAGSQSTGKPWPSPEGRLCALGGGGEVRCTDAADDLLPPDVVTDPVVESAHLLATADGIVASYVSSSTVPYEFRTIGLGAGGQPLGPELPLSQFPANANGHATGAVAKPDGSFALLLTAGADVVWFPFHADGQLDATNVATIAQGGRAKVVSAPSGRFLLAWYTAMASPSGDTCPIMGRLFSADAQPEDDEFVIYDAPAGRCAARYDVAVGPSGDVGLAWLEYTNGGSYAAKAILLPGVLAE